MAGGVQRSQNSSKTGTTDGGTPKPPKVQQYTASANGKGTSNNAQINSKVNQKEFVPKPLLNIKALNASMKNEGGNGYDKE